MSTKNANPGSSSAKDNNVVLPNSASEYLQHYLPDRDAEPFPLSTLTDQMGLTAPRIPARDLLDKPFIILAAKTFGSAFDPERHAYFCIIKDAETGQLFSTVLGGFAVTDILDAVCNSGFDQPLLVTMREIPGGRFGHYYVLE